MSHDAPPPPRCSPPPLPPLRLRPQATPPTPDGPARLPDTAEPLRYTLDLRLDPAADQLRGELILQIRLHRPQRALTLHGEGLTLSHSAARLGDDRRPLTPQLGDDGRLTLTAAHPLPAGVLDLELSWTAPIGQTPEGLYSVRVGDARYLFTQFEPLAARRVFPCFDEPGFKAPLSLAIRAPRGLTVLANTATIGRRADGDALVWIFEETPPLPSYLYAFAVGPFDVVSAPADSCPVPLRIITTRGRGHLARAALEITPRLLAALETTIGVPYPYGKLDLVGVPDFAAGAMENVGLLMFREGLLLLDLKRAPLRDRMWAEIVIAHELAHMWFGNLVTMAWWDELWLNEAFATYLETQAVQAVSPAYEVELEAVRETDRVMGHDALTEARAIRQPIADGGDVLNAFDAITYGKGAAVVQMLVAWLGAGPFWDGVRRYLAAHAHGTARTDDLLTALEATSGRNVKPILRAFLDQPGVPCLALAPSGPARDRWTWHINRHRSGGAAETAGAWQLPVRLRYTPQAGGPPIERAILLDQPTGVLQLDPPAAALHPNADELGYYRWRLPLADLRALIALPESLRPTERVALPGHLWALLEAEHLDAGEWCLLASDLAADPHRLVLGAIIDGLRRLDAAVPQATRGAWATWIRRLLSPHARRFGFRSRPEEPPNVRLARPTILRTLADLGADAPLRAALAAEGESLLQRFHRADPERARLCLPIAAWAGEPTLLDRILAAVEAAPTPAHRQAALTALGSPRSPAQLEDSLERFFSPALRAQDLFTLLRPAAQRPETRATLSRWLDRRHQGVLEKTGPETAAHLPRLWASAASATARARVEAFFEPAQRRPPGTDRILRQVLEGIDRNHRLVERARGPLDQFLQNEMSPSRV